MPSRLVRPLQPMSSKISVNCQSIATYHWQLSILRQSSACQSQSALILNSKPRAVPLGTFIDPNSDMIFQKHSCVHPWKSQALRKEGLSHPSALVAASHDSVKSPQLPGREEEHVHTNNWRKNRQNVRLRSNVILIIT